MFGGGALNHYGINSNTSAYSFIKFLYQKKVFHKTEDDDQEGEQLKETLPGANNKQPNKDDAVRFAESDCTSEDEYTSKIVKTPLPAFAELYPNSAIMASFIDFAHARIPLSMVGILQNYVGNHLLNHIYETTGKRVFHPFRKVLSIQLQPNGEYLIKVLKLDFNSDEQEIVYFKSKAILKNPGAYPFFPENFYTEMFPNVKSE